MISRASLTAAALLACVVLGCNKDEASGGGSGGSSSAAKVDTSTPKATATAFAKALQSGDMATAKGLTTNGGDAEYKTLQAMADMMVGFKTLNDAAVAKFGADNGLPKEMNMDLAAQVDRGEIKIDGDKATIHMKDTPDEKKPMGLVKKDGGWKVDLSSLEKDEGNTKMMEAAPAMRKGLEGVAADITAGKIKTKEEMMPALQKVFLSMMGGPDVPTPPPATPAIPGVK